MPELQAGYSIHPHNIAWRMSNQDGNLPLNAGLPEHIGETECANLGGVGPVTHDDKAGERCIVTQELYV